MSITTETSPARENLDEKRETRTITLPVSGKKVELLTYYTRRERLQIEQVMHSHGRMEVTRDPGGVNHPKIELDMAGQAAQREKAIEISVVSIDGKPASMNMINDLRNKDAIYLEEEIQKIDNDDDEKKS